MFSKKRTYKNIDDIYRYIDGCYVIWKGDSVRRISVTGGNLVTLNAIHRGQKLVTGVDYRDDRITYGGLRVGFLNTQEGTFLLSRISHRNQQKNGLNAQCITCTTAFAPDSDGMPSFNSKHFEDMVLDKYPTYQECFNRVKDMPIGSGLAFSKAFALVKTNRSNISLQLGNNQIGMLKIKDGPEGRVYPIEDQYVSHLMKRLAPHGVNL